MRSILVLSLAVLFLAVITGCSSTLSKGGSGMPGEDGQISDEELALASRGRWGEGAIPNAQADGLFEDVRFNYDSAVVPKEYHETLRKNAQFLLDDQSLRSEIEGHCDKRGTNEYNLALGEERARAVASLMVNYGVAADRLTTISYGEEIPVDPSDIEAAYAKNRRAHFALFRKDAAK